jgi:hypothetical protein
MGSQQIYNGGHRRFLRVMLLTLGLIVAALLW